MGIRVATLPGSSGHSDEDAQIMTPFNVQGVDVPPLLYGTAWKQERTASLVSAALATGFRGIDTANQRKHYHEAGVGEALREWGESMGEPIFVQTKFTHIEGQDERLPYDSQAEYADQVLQSFDSSLEHLGLARIDSFLLHGPRTRHGWSAADRDVWQAMESLQREGKTRLIGVSNTSAEQLAELCEFAEILPAFIQNRCYAQLGWDRGVRDVCGHHDIVYQGFSLLTANPMVLSNAELVAVARRHERTPEQVVFRFAHQVGMICLTGTTDEQHMEQDLAVTDFELEPAEVRLIEHIAG